MNVRVESPGVDTREMPSRLAGLSDLVRARWDDARWRVMNGSRDLEATVRREPTRSAVVALAVGLAVGFILRRRQLAARGEVFLG
jgi:hypothetical protein